MQKTDIAILGGGIAGLWLLNVLTMRGYSVVLLEAEALGAGQTLASQGMIHGGIKYALDGVLNDASETIAGMPERWQECLDGKGSIDLSNVKALSSDYYLFSDASLTSKVTAFFGSKTIKGRVDPVPSDELPSALQHKDFKGLVYKLQDFVLDTGSLIEELAKPHQPHIYTGQFGIDCDESEIATITLADGTQLCADHYVLAAGSGNGELIQQLGIPITMQLRPLNQVLVQGAGLPSLYAHAVSLRSGDKPKLTITSHHCEDNTTCWYLGGQLAETGVGLSDADQIGRARQELNRLFPWLDFDNCNFSTLPIDRAEPSQKDHKRPDTPFAQRFANNIVCWPTKLTLAPLLGDMVAAMFEADSNHHPTPVFDAEVQFANSPWDVPR